MEEEEYRPRQYATDGGLVEVDFRSMAKSNDKSAIPNRDPTHPSGGKRKRGEEEDVRSARRAAAAAAARGKQTARVVLLPDASAHALARARQEEEEAMAVDAGATGAADDPDIQPNKRRAYDNVSGKVSGRPWKATFGRASSIAAARPPADWDLRMREKAQKKAIQARLPPQAPSAQRCTRTTDAQSPWRLAAAAQAHVAGVKKEARDKAVAEKKRREEVKARREVNRKASQVVQKARAARRARVCVCRQGGMGQTARRRAC
jgi:hypothetical protein